MRRSHTTDSGGRRGAEAADANEEGCGSQAAVSSCGGEMNGGTGKMGPGGSGSGRSEADVCRPELSETWTTGDPTVAAIHEQEDGTGL